ncbi:glycosyl transferase [Intrasporangium oryzae NRRL B-24470]|uniref:Glycosyl transferase n=1 Tax=Intrasporangium oryzae NRRL B-24470 TaxID=1386089 RepID=W9GBI6_9MICO|nr:glycosyltransferase family 4 protein [Intrasporangium oryzae]EWT02582.1 glycosyl transferase [Intrasporangium oryzae NRRL B-24470]
MSTGRAVHVVVPDGVDDPARPSGGNTYDRRVCQGLAALGWSVTEHAVPGPWPSPDRAASAALGTVVDGIRDGDVVLVDGLVASPAPEVLVPQSRRMRLVVLVHLPLGAGTPGEEGLPTRHRERAVLSAARAVVTTSEWTRRWLLDQYGLDRNTVHVARPGVDPAEPTPGTATGGELLCVAAVAPHKGHDVLVEALAAVQDLSWRCVLVGGSGSDRAFVETLDRRARSAGVADRLHFTGALTGASLEAAYAAADVLVLASRGETYGMVVAEALARGLPVIATAVGGLPEALGAVAGGRPGLLVPPDEPEALASALRCWLVDGALRERLRALARERRETLPGWTDTSTRIARVLSEVAA